MPGDGQNSSCILCSQRHQPISWALFQFMGSYYTVYMRSYWSISFMTLKRIYVLHTRQNAGKNLWETKWEGDRAHRVQFFHQLATPLLVMTQTKADVPSLFWSCCVSAPWYQDTSYLLQQAEALRTTIRAGVVNNQFNYYGVKWESLTYWHRLDA